MSRSVSIFGLGYVGSVTAACLAAQGHRVVGVDVNEDKVRAFNAGRSPVLEPGLEELLRDGADNGLIRATSDVEVAVTETEISFICVGTPSQGNGKLDLSVVSSVSESVGTALRNKPGRHCVVVRSTVLPGTSTSVVVPALETASWKKAGDDFSVCSNPEFLREGSAIEDFMNPPMTVIGCDDEYGAQIVRSLYEWAPGEIFDTSRHAAEMIKYASNCFHALKITFANEIGTLCKRLQVDADEVIRIFTADERLNISPAYLKPGFAFGGSCLPKDLRAISYCAKELDIDIPLLDSILPSNDQHLERAVAMVLEQNCRDVALLGLSFKPGTDDLRESPHIQLVKRLLGEGCKVRIWDPNVSMGRVIGSNRAFIEETIPHIGSLLHNDIDEVVSGAEIIILGTTYVDKEEVSAFANGAQSIIDLVHLDKDARPKLDGYRGICW